MRQVGCVAGRRPLALGCLCGSGSLLVGLFYLGEVQVPKKVLIIGFLTVFVSLALSPIAFGLEKKFAHVGDLAAGPVSQIGDRWCLCKLSIPEGADEVSANINDGTFDAYKDETKLNEESILDCDCVPAPCPNHDIALI